MLPITEKDYYTFFTQREVYKKAIEIGYTNAFFLDENELDPEDMEKIRTSGKAIIILYFDRDQYMIISGIKEKLSYPEIKTSAFCLDYFLPLFEEDDGIPEFSHYTLCEAINYLPKCNVLEKVLSHRSMIKCSDHTGRCGNCHHYIDENNKFCQICGTEKGKGDFLPFYEEMFRLWGMPVKVEFKCGLCKHIWITDGEEGEYCPECGAKTAELIRRSRPFQEDYAEEQND